MSSVPLSLVAARARRSAPRRAPGTASATFRAWLSPLQPPPTPPPPLAPRRRSPPPSSLHSRRPLQHRQVHLQAALFRQGLLQGRAGKAQGLAGQPPEPAAGAPGGRLRRVDRGRPVPRLPPARRADLRVDAALGRGRHLRRQERREAVQQAARALRRAGERQRALAPACRAAARAIIHARLPPALSPPSLLAQCKSIINWYCGLSDFDASLVQKGKAPGSVKPPTPAEAAAADAADRAKRGFFGRAIAAIGDFFSGD